MSLQDKLFEMGIGSWSQDIITLLPATASGTTFPIGKQLATDVGFIYGLSTYADSLDAQGNTLITTTQAQNLFLTLQDGATQFYQEIRLDDLLNTFAGTPVNRSDKFMPVAIPAFDLSKSFYNNPAAFVSVPPVSISIHLKMYYIPMINWIEIKKKITLDRFLKHLYGGVA